MTEGILEIHGNWKYMRCSNESGSCESKNHFFNFPKLPSHEDLAHNLVHVPSCNFCGSVMKPHTMLFDEMYREEFYRVESAMEHLKEADTVMLIGTAWYTSLAMHIVTDALWKRKNLIDVNPQSQLSKVSFLRNVCCLQGNAENVLPELVGSDQF